MNRRQQSDGEGRAGGLPAAGSSRSRHPLDWPANTGAVEDVLYEVEVRLNRRRRRHFVQVLSAALALLLVGGTWHVMLGEHGSEAAPPYASPIVWRPRQETLPDGTRVDFRNSAAIAVAYSDTQRRVILERGEVHFDVARDTQRPFVVVAGPVEFRAVGTAFAVSRSDQRVEMYVTEGRVAVRAQEDRTPAAGMPHVGAATGSAPDPAATPAPEDKTEIVLDAGKHVTVETAVRGAPPIVSSISGSGLSQRLAWRAPKVEFSATPLPDVIAIINEHAANHGGHRLVLGDDSLAGVRISGILRADNIETLIGVLNADHGITAEDGPGGILALVRAR
jgi:transmembrane sensor